MQHYDVILIGSGIAALSAATRLMGHKNVAIFTKSAKTVSNTYLAQGGIAAAMDAADHWQEHFHDTMTAGVYHNDPATTQLLTKEAPRYMAELIGSGMKFDRDGSGVLHLGREGGHWKRRILHAGGDATGRALVTHLLEQLQEQIDIVEGEMVIDLLTCDGQCLGIRTRTAGGENKTYLAAHTILATGGCGQLYAHTSNAPTITGDGIAMAYRAGAFLTDMEFMQFHPTVLYKDGKALGLVSEAVRGEGAILRNAKGERFMEQVHPLQELAPRDIVARAIHHELQSGRQVYLDVSPVRGFASRFPTIYRLCLDCGIDMQAGLLPVIPAAHFLMGGIKTDEQGRTTVKGLYAIGEAACTGVHGANRLASNSLLEGLVFGQRTADGILHSSITLPDRVQPDETAGSVATALPSKQEIREMMTEHAGIVRNEQGLTALRNWLAEYDFVHLDHSRLTNEQIEVVNMLTVAWLITNSALERKESIGSHYRSDYPQSGGKKARTEIVRHLVQERVVRG